MSIHRLFEQIEQLVDKYVALNFVEVTPKQLCLDERSAQMIYISPDAIAVPKHSVRSMEYYAGFEYVDPEHRTEAGDYVFYSAEDGRVSDHIEGYYYAEEEVL